MTPLLASAHPVHLGAGPPGAQPSTVALALTALAGPAGRGGPCCA